VPTDREQIELAFNIELETRRLTGEIAKVDREIKRMVSRKLPLKAFDKKSVAEFDKAVGQANKDLKALQGSLGRKALTKEFAAVEKATNRLYDSMLRETTRLGKVRRKIESDLADFRKKNEEEISRARTTEEKEFLKEYLKLQEEGLKERLRKEEAASQKSLRKSKRALRRRREELLKGAGKRGAAEEVATRTRKAKETQEALRGVLGHKTGEEIGEGIKDILSSMSGKDLAGVGKAGVKLSSDLLKGLGKGTVKLGDKLATQGAGMGGRFGGALEGVGGLMKSMGPIIGTVAKLGPVLSAAASILVSIVKLMVDVEAQAKGFNKQILEGASTAETLYHNAGKSGAAFKDLDRTLDNIRDEATDVAENMKWGMKAENVIQVTNAFAQQGVTLESLKQSFKNAGDAAEESGAQIQGFGELARMSFAYSRLMGVSLQEITDLQSEMFTELGTSLSGMKLEFAKMTKEATESGIATNKFFSILRSASTDLSLYTTRIGQAAVMLKLLGKVMNPREAQKFFQTATQGLKQMSEEDRLRMTLLAGEGKMRSIVTKDIQRKSDLMAADIKSAVGGATEKSAEDITKMMEGARKGSKADYEGLVAIIEKAPKEMQGGFKSALSEIKMDTNALVKGGIMGLQEAASNLSAAGALTATKAALQRFGGGKKLRDMTGMQAFAARKAAGVSLEQFRAQAKLESAVDDQREEMARLLDKPLDQLTEDDKKALARMKILHLDNKKTLKEADDADIIAAMEKGQQEALAEAAEQKDYAAETFKATTSMLDKVDMVIEGIFEYLYVALKDIIADLNEFINMMASSPLFKIPAAVLGKKTEKDEGRQALDVLRKGQTDKNAPIVKALRTAVIKEGPGDAKSRMIGALGPALSKGIGESMKKDAGKSIMDDLQTLTAKGVLEGPRAADIAQMSGVGGSTLKIFEDALKAGKTFQKAAGEAGFTAEDYQKILQKSVWAMKPSEIAEIFPNLKTVQAGMGGAAAAPAKVEAPPGAPPPPTTTGQAASTQKSAAPGTGGAGAAVQAQTAAAAPPGAPPITPGAPAAPGGINLPSLPDEQKMTQTVMEQIDFTGDATVNSLHDLWKALRMKGIKLDRTQLEGEYKEVIRKGSLEAIREALFEYALYTGTSTLQKMQQSGVDEVAAMADKFEEDQKKKASFVNPLAPKAEGGLVTGIAGGKAVFAPPGEGLTSIGPGERITPAGGGGGGTGGAIHLHVSGLGGADLANYLRDKIAQGVYEYKRREKFQ
jgi:hypothetical protein